MDLRGTVDIYKSSLSTKVNGNMEMATYAALSLALPFLLPQSQLLLGSVVNSTLVLSALFLKGRKVLPAIILPSIGAVANGIMLGPLSSYLILMLPFIWAGNALLVGGTKLLYVRMKANAVLSSTASIAAKTAVIFCGALALYSLGLVPSAFLTAMGIVQVITAAIGCSSAFALARARKDLNV